MSYPLGSMYGIITYIWLICMVNVGQSTIHGWYGDRVCNTQPMHSTLKIVDVFLPNLRNQATKPGPGKWRNSTGVFLTKHEPNSPKAMKE